MLRILKILVLSITGILLLAVIAIGIWLRSSLPQLDGELHVTGVADVVSIERDDNGVVTIIADQRSDAAYATGFVHAQDRFFQMDIARRYAAGELSELFGERALGFDRRQRRHQMRQRAEQSIAALPNDYRQFLAAYVAGVNDGLQALNSKPFEYSLLGISPKQWKITDSALVLASMYFQLQAGDANLERVTGWLADCLSDSVFDFIAPVGTEWDSPLTGGVWPVTAVPTEAQLNIRELPALAQNTHFGNRAIHAIEDPVFGSNNWALSGARSESGAALVADDMHLGFNVPHIWYRLRLQTQDLPKTSLDITGVTLPGMPFVVVGSNTHIAWGFTNSYGDWLDLVKLETTFDNTQYMTSQGNQPFTVELETINVKGADSVVIEVKHTRWGPVIDEIPDNNGMNVLYAWRWVGHMPEFFTAPGLLSLEQAQNVEEAVAAAPEASIPAQNLVVGDQAGNIGWTIMGRIPIRDNAQRLRWPLDWQNADEGWRGWLPANEYPQVINPVNGQIWTANNRQVGGEALNILGYGNVDLGARARQIENDLSALDTAANEADMQAIQLDDRALFLARWKSLLLSVLDEEARRDNSKREAIYQQVMASSDAAKADAVGYRLVREFRVAVKSEVMRSLTRQCPAPSQSFAGTRQAERPLWQIMQQRPMHLLDAAYSDWNSFLLTQVDTLAKDVQSLEDYTWGDRNRHIQRHALSGGIPVVGQFLNMANTPMSGDRDMPRVHQRGSGQSQRMAVAPGHEEQGYMVMPGGQSGHPLSPYYRSLHQDWLDGEMTSFMPGATKHILQLLPR